MAVERISHYRLVRRVGIGGQAVVFLAEDERTGRSVALKVLAAPTAALLGGRRRRLEREAKVLDQLEHPGLCGVEEVALDHDLPYLAMRFVEGETLRRSVVDHAPPPAAGTDLVLELVESVAVAHRGRSLRREILDEPLVRLRIRATISAATHRSVA